MNTVTLNEIVRQNDDDFSGLLNDVRVGELSDKQLDILNSCVVSRKSPLPMESYLPSYTVLIRTWIRKIQIALWSCLETR